MNNPLQQQGDDTNKENDISSKKVGENLGKIQNNLTKTLKDPKFLAAFMLGYPAIQKVVDS